MDRHNRHYRQVTKTRKKTSHTFHLLMTIFTFGFWGLFVWLPVILWNTFGPRKKLVTVSRMPAPAPMPGMYSPPLQYHPLPPGNPYPAPKHVAPGGHR